jgi:dimethylargininase
MPIAITRGVSPRIVECELTHLTRQPIDLEIARQEHHAYEACLSSLGCTLHRLPAEPELPDSVFVEDTALVFDAVAVITRPGAPSRRPETESIAAVLSEYRPLVHLTAPSRLDGGDVLTVGRHVYVGRSTRSNDEAVVQLSALLAPFDYSVMAVPVQGILHLKSAVGLVAPDTLLVNRACVDPECFGDVTIIDVDPTEPTAACALAIDGTVIFPAIYPRTRERLESAGLAVVTVPLTELAKAEAGVTCCSLIVGP